MSISQKTINATLQSIRSIATEYSASYAGVRDAVNAAADLIAKLVKGNALATDSTPKALGTLIFGDDFVGNKTPDNWQSAFVHAIVRRLRADGTLEQGKARAKQVVTIQADESSAETTNTDIQPPADVSLPTLDQLKALAHLADTHLYYDAVVCELKTTEVKVLADLFKLAV